MIAPATKKNERCRVLGFETGRLRDSEDRELLVEMRISVDRYAESDGTDQGNVRFANVIRPVIRWKT
jgi:hypothetical protein